VKKIIDWLKRWHDVHVLQKVGDDDDEDDDDDDDDDDACMMLA
jgi:hypothetical protein